MMYFVLVLLSFLPMLPAFVNSRSTGGLRGLVAGFCTLNALGMVMFQMAYDQGISYPVLTTIWCGVFMILSLKTALKRVDN